MKNYLDLCRKIIKNGNKREDRTGTGTISLFGEQLVFDLKKGFPLVTTKKVFFKGIVGELLWILSGNTNTKFLKDNGINIWNAWQDNNGDLGPVYGFQLRNFNNEGVDQIKNIINEIKTNPTSRRLVAVMFNPAQIDKMALPPCPSFFQFYVNKKDLSLHLYQRSADMFLGVPFDIAVYALLLELVAIVCDLKADKLVISYGDVHIYKNHIKQIKEQLEREPLKLPKVKLSKLNNIFDYTFEDIILINYKSHEKIVGKISV